MDYYNILGITRDANSSEIKKAYHKLAKENHPDKHPGDKEKENTFKNISQAYEILSDNKKRNHYDMYGSNETTQPQFTNPNNLFDTLNQLFERNSLFNNTMFMNQGNIPFNQSFSQSTVTVIRNGKSYTKTTTTKNGVTSTTEKEMNLSNNPMGFIS